MKSISLEKAFNIAFFEKDSFRNFLELNPSENFKKSDYSGRVVFEPTAKLKSYHKFINDYIISYLNVEKDVVFSYRKGSSTYNAVVPHSHSTIFYNTDISDFFPSVNRIFSKKILEKNYEAIPINDIDKYIDVLLDYIIADDALPVGFSTSPSFSNACLFEFDKCLHDYCSERGYVYSRYSDDIIVSSNIEDGFEDIHNSVISLLAQCCDNLFKINEEKTKIVRRGNKVKLLGMVVLPSGKISVDIKVKKRIEHLIHFYVTDKTKFVDSVVNDGRIATENLNSEQILEKGVGALSGLLNHINTIDKPYLDKLRKKYGNAIVDMFFHKNVK